MIWVRAAIASLGLGALAAYFLVEVYKAFKKGSLRTTQGHRSYVVLKEKEPAFFFFILAIWSVLGLGAVWGWVAAIRHIFSGS